jgi:hypothetical protein
MIIIKMNKMYFTKIPTSKIELKDQEQQNINIIQLIMQ